MAAIEEISVKCPGCGKEQSAKVRRSVNAASDPAVRDALFAWEINVFVCSECGVRAMLPVDLLYVDREKGIAVQYYPLDALGSEDFYVNFKKNGEPIKAPKVKDADGNQLKLHLVFDTSEMMRYIAFREIAFQKGH